MRALQAAIWRHRAAPRGMAPWRGMEVPVGRPCPGGGRPSGVSAQAIAGGASWGGPIAKAAAWSSAGALPGEEANAHVVGLDFKLKELLLKLVHPGVDGGVSAMVPVEIGPELPHQADEDFNPLKEGVVRLVQGQRPPSGLLARSAVSLRRECGAHAAIEPRLRRRGGQRGG